MMKNLDDLIKLQGEQLQHDERSHTDILYMSFKGRITHMTLHFAKYVGALSEKPNDERLQRVLIDAGIITLASANCLNVDLGFRIKGTKDARSAEELAEAVGVTEANVRMLTLTRLAIATGVMAKACESLDHQEKGDWRSVLEEGILEIACVVLASAHVLRIDFVERVRARWRAVEAKSAFSRLPDVSAGESAGLPVALVRTG